MSPFFMMPAPKNESRRLTKGARLSTGMLIYIFYNQTEANGTETGTYARIWSLLRGPAGFFP